MVKNIIYYILKLDFNLTMKTEIVKHFSPIESARPTNKRRKRKGAAQTAPGSAGGGPGGPGGPGAVGGKKRSPGPNFSLASQVK